MESFFFYRSIGERQHESDLFPLDVILALALQIEQQHYVIFFTFVIWRYYHPMVRRPDSNPLFLIFDSNYLTTKSPMYPISEYKKVEGIFQQLKVFSQTAVQYEIKYKQTYKKSFLVMQIKSYMIQMIVFEKLLNNGLSPSGNSIW